MSDGMETGAPQAVTEGAEKTYCIEVYADGTFKVGLEPPEGEMGQDQNAPPAAEEDAGMQQVGSLDEAFDAIRQMEVGPEEVSARADMQAGFNQAMGKK